MLFMNLSIIVLYESHCQCDVKDGKSHMKVLILRVRFVPITPIASLRSRHEILNVIQFNFGVIHLIFVMVLRRYLQCISSIFYFLCVNIFYYQIKETKINIYAERLIMTSYCTSFSE